jgi:hypothetical protein
MPTYELTFGVQLEDPQTQAVLRLNESGGFSLIYEPVPVPAETGTEDGAEQLSPEDEVAARDAVAAEIETRWPSSGFKPVFDAQLAAGRQLLAPRPRPNAQARMLYLRLVGKSASGLDISVYLNPRAATVTRRDLLEAAAKFPGTTRDTRDDVVAPYDSVDVNALIEALFAL